MKQRSKIMVGGLAIILVFGIVVTIGIASHRKGDGQTSSKPSTKKSSLTFTSNGPKMSGSSNTSITKKDINKIMKLDFTECKKARDQKGLDECLQKVYEMYSRISKDRSQNLIHEKFKLAKYSKFNYPPNYVFKNEFEKHNFKAGICFCRYELVKGIGELNDPEVKDVLLSLIEEKITDDSGCFICVPSENSNSMCKEAGQVLVKLNPQGVSERIYQDFERSLIDYENTYSKIYNTSQEYHFDFYNEIDRFNLDSSILEGPRCYVSILSQVSGGRKIIFDNLSSGKLSEHEIIFYLDEVKNYTLNPDETLILLHYLNYNDIKEDESIALKAAVALTKNPIKQNEDIYINIMNEYRFGDGLSALAKIHPQAALLYISETLKLGRSSRINSAAMILSKYPEEDIRPLLPILINDLRNDHNNQNILQPIIKAQDGSVINDLLQMAYDGSIYSIEAIGKIQSIESQEALKVLISDKNINQSLRKDALFWYLFQVGEKGADYCLIYFDKNTVYKILENFKKP